MSTEDTILIQACLAGRSEAFDELVVRYQDRLYHTLVHVLGSREDAHDAAQDAFTHAYLNLASFRGHSAFYSWLFRIALNAAVSLKRKSRRMTTSLDAMQSNGNLIPSGLHLDASPSLGMERSEQQDTVRAALGELSEEFRTVLVLKEIEGLRYEEIAEITDCPIGTVRSRIHRARNELRKKLEILMKGDL